MTVAPRAGLAAIAVACGVALSGCGSDTAGQATRAEDSTGAATSTSAPATTSAAPTTAPDPVGADGITIEEYVQQNGITSTPVLRGEPGAPTITLPFPPGWEDAGARMPEGAYSAIIYTGPPPSQTPPVITAYLTKLTGAVDQARVLELAPAETLRLPGYQGATSGQASMLANFPATQIGGFYTTDGLTRLIAQKTVVMPAPDGLFVLKIRAEGTEDLASPLMEATAAIDDQTTITL